MESSPNEKKAKMVKDLVYCSGCLMLCYNTNSVNYECGHSRCSHCFKMNHICQRCDQIVLDLGQCQRHMFPLDWICTSCWVLLCLHCISGDHKPFRAKEQCDFVSVNEVVVSMKKNYFYTKDKATQMIIDEKNYYQDVILKLNNIEIEFMNCYEFWQSYNHSQSHLYQLDVQVALSNAEITRENAKDMFYYLDLLQIELESSTTKIEVVWSLELMEFLARIYTMCDLVGKSDQFKSSIEENLKSWRALLDSHHNMT